MKKNILFFILFFLITYAAYAELFYVTNTNDSGPGSFRQAIINANRNPNNTGPDEIHFDLEESSYTIQPNEQLPVINDPVIIDGTTQPGFINSPIIELDGSNSTSTASGLIISGGDSTIEGLIINRFNKFGIKIQRNGNNQIYGNFIGTDITGSIDFGNGLDGIIIYNSSYNVIGGADYSLKNIVSANRRNGIHIVGDYAYRNIVQGNFIGTNITGKLNLGNNGSGVVLDVYAADNIIGHAETGVGYKNVIAFNGGDGIHIKSGVDNPIISNSIFANGGLAIDLGENGVNENEYNDRNNYYLKCDPGANRKQNYPFITKFTRGEDSTVIEGKLISEPNQNYFIQLFTSPSFDPSFHGEGKTNLGGSIIATNNEGISDFSILLFFEVPTSLHLSLTATDFLGNTSEFGRSEDFDGLTIIEEDVNNDGNPTNDDTDYDGTPNYLDTDSDDDTILDGIDNCYLVPNIDQIDSDGNGIGDACEEDYYGDGDSIFFGYKIEEEADEDNLENVIILGRSSDFPWPLTKDWH